MAQQPGKVRRIGVLMGFSERDSEARRWVAAFERKLAELGWKEGIDLRIEYRRPQPDRLSTDAADMVNQHIVGPTIFMYTN
jgi:hypothetical protein